MLTEQETPEISSTETQQKSGSSTVALAIRSAVGTLVVLVLLFGCFLSFFPYSAMRLYSELDLREMALVSAERYLSRNAKKYSKDNPPEAYGKYADALYYAVNTSVDFMNSAASEQGYDSSKAIYYAKRVDKYAGEYTDYNVVTSLLPRTQKVDEYSVAHTRPAIHPYVCDYLGSIGISRFKAWYILGDEQSMRVRVERTLPWLSLDDHQELNSVKIADLYLLLGQLSAYIDCELDRLGLTAAVKQSKNGFISFEDVGDDTLFAPKNKPFDLFIGDDGRFTAWYNYLVEYFDDILDAVRQNARRYVSGSTEEDVNEHLRYTRYLMTLDDFGKSMINMTAVFYSQSKYFADEHSQSVRDSFGTWQSKVLSVPADGVRVFNPDTGNYEVKSEGSVISLSDWYSNGMLYDYLAFWRPASA